MTTPQSSLIFLILVLGSFIFSVKLVAAAKGNSAPPVIDPLEWVEKHSKFVIDYIATKVMGVKEFIEYVWDKYIYTPIKDAIAWVFKTAVKNITSGINAVTSGINKFVKDFQSWMNGVREGLVNAAKGFIEMLSKMLGLGVMWSVVQ